MTSPEVRLPPQVLDLAYRLGAQPAGTSKVARFRQSGWLRQRPDAAKMSFSATQSIALDATEFEWKARCGPLSAISVTDFLRAGDGGGIVKLFGMLPLARSTGNPGILKGEIMRYLAELVWAPDAMLRNSGLTWRLVDESSIAVSAGAGPARGEVTYHLSAAGLVERISAPDRPREEEGATVETPWWGWLGGYELIEGRLLPTFADVGWTLNGAEFLAFHGEIADWRME